MSSYSSYTNSTESSDLELDVPFNFTDILDETARKYEVAFKDYVDGVGQLQEVHNTVNADDVWNKPIVIEAVNDAGKGTIPEITNKFSVEDGETVTLATVVKDESEGLYGRYLKYGNWAISLQATVAEIERVLKESVSDEEYKAIMDKVKNDYTIDSIESFVESDPTLKRIVNGTLIKNGTWPFKETTSAIGHSILTLDFGELKNVLSWDSFKKQFLGFYGKGKGLAESPLVAKSSVTQGLGSAALQLAWLTGLDLSNGTFSLEKEIENIDRSLVSFGSTTVGVSVASYLATSTSIGAAAGPAGVAVAVGLSVVGNALIDEIHRLKMYNDIPEPENYQELTVEVVRAALEQRGSILEVPKIYQNESVYDTFSHLEHSGISSDLLDYMTQAVDQSSNIMETDTFNKRYKVSSIAKQCISDCNLAYDDLSLSFFNEDIFVESINNNYYPLDSEDEMFVRKIYRLFIRGRNTSDPRLQTVWNDFFIDGVKYNW